MRRDAGFPFVTRDSLDDDTDAHPASTAAPRAAEPWQTPPPPRVLSSRGSPLGSHGGVAQSPLLASPRGGGGGDVRSNPLRDLFPPPWAPPPPAAPLDGVVSPMGAAAYVLRSQRLRDGTPRC